MNWVASSNLSFALMEAQARAGICVDTEKLRDLYDKIEGAITDIEEEIEPTLPITEANKGEIKAPPKNQFRKDGTLSAHAQKYFQGLKKIGGVGDWSVEYPDGIVEKLPTTRPLVTERQMKLKDGNALKQYLIDKWGWRPFFDWNTDKDGEPTSPKLKDATGVCPGLYMIDWPYVDKLIEYNSLKNRIGRIWNPEKGTGFLADPRVLEEGKLTPGSYGLTNTHRQRHAQVANLPGANALLGKEFRSCFIPSPGNVLVGYDASSLEDRCKAHLTYPYDGGEYARKILDPTFDPHTESAMIWFGELHAKDPKAARTKAKAPNYALPYGVGIRKFANLLGVSVQEAKEKLEMYWEANKPVELHAKTLAKETKKNDGWIRGLDGRPFHVRSEHKLFNTACQGSGSIIMDLAGILMYKYADYVDMSTGTYIKNGKKYTRVLYTHDEYLWDCDPDIAEWVREKGLQSIRDADTLLPKRLNVPMEAEGCIGSNYFDVH